jgi:hypothetical protein
MGFKVSIITAIANDLPGGVTSFELVVDGNRCTPCTSDHDEDTCEEDEDVEG